MSLAVLLASLAVFAPLPAHFTVQRGDCPQMQARSCAEPDGTIYFAETLDGSDEVREVLAHELGHVWDFQNLTDADRGHWAQVVGATPAQWATNDPLPVGTLPTRELFADAYALCAMGPRWRRDFRSWWGPLEGTYGERIGQRTLAMTCWWLRHPPKH